MDEIQKTIFDLIIKTSYQLLQSQKTKKVYKKSLRDLVTSSDYSSQKIIINQIKKKFPTHKIFSEENFGQIQDLNSDHCWIIDPLDGTNNYVYGLDLWGISIAYAKNSILEYGAISYPRLNTILFAKRGMGAYQYFFSKNKIKKLKKLKVSDRELQDSMLLTCYAQGENLSNTFKKLEKLQKKVFHIRHLGAAVFEIGYVAQGYADGAILFKIKPYDIAAGALLVKESDGKVTKLDGSPYTLDSTNFIASNKKIHDNLIEILNSE